MGVLWYNGHIYTMESDGKKVEAVFTDRGKIIATGSLFDLETTFRDHIQKKVNLAGGTMIPGLVDGHMHLLGYGESLIRLDLSKVKSKEELLLAVRKKTMELKEGDWLIGEGWNENLWEVPILPTLSELDEASLGMPTVLKRVCRHAVLANSKALQLAGIHKDTANPPGGVIERDHDGNATGFIKDKAIDLLQRAMPSYSFSYLKNLALRAIQSCYTYGLTGSHTEDLNYYGSFLHTYEALRQGVEELPYRTHLLVHHGVVEEWKRLEKEGLPGNPYIQFGGMKIFADGSLGSRTALLSRPYGDDPSTNGVAIQTKKELSQLVEKARSYRLPVAIHAIGDLAFEWVLEAIKENPLPGKGRDRIIHAQILRKELVREAKKLQVVLDIQPRFLISDFPWVLNRLGDFRPDYLYAWKSLLKEGIPCGGGSDAPIEPVDPLLGIHAAVTRKNVADEYRKVYHPEERLTMYEAVSLFTKGNAYASCNERIQGIIRPDFIADFTVFDRNIFEIDPDELLETKVVMTVLDGKIVYER